MNAGADLNKALKQAKFNAKSSKEPWTLHSYNGVYWIEKLSGFDSYDALDYVIMPEGNVLNKDEIKKIQVVSCIAHPATQFHIALRHRLTEKTKPIIEKALRIDFSGFIHVEFTPKRAIVTTSCPVEDREKWSKAYIKAITEALEKNADV